MKKVKEMVNCEVKEAKKAVKEAKEAYYKSIREWLEAECSIDYTGYLPEETPDELIKDIIKKSPNITQEKLGYEIACYFRNVLRAKEEVLNRLQTV